MVPKTIKKFTPDDILVGENDTYVVGDKRSPIGWLIHLFLYDDTKEFVEYTKQDSKDFKRAIQRLGNLAGLHKDDILEEWEETISAKQGAKVMNKLRKELGYA